MRKISFQSAHVHSTSELMTFARRYLTAEYNVFAHIPATAATQIDHFFVIRNLVSHYSSFALRSYDRMLRTQYGHRRSHAPGEFLLARDRKPGHHRRIFRFMDAFKNASHRMRAAS